ncbi:MAG: hypothetical protein BWY80_00871 [Firmicutes bacterium ADurb.Bin456]|nr:MAG: hypothetical protein BWY80_00871 [Firmicutes bacterium ADurb.Bin456]
MQYRVAGASDGHIQGDGVAEGVQGHDIPGPDVVLDHLHSLPSSQLGQGLALTIRGRNGTVAGKAYPQGFRQAVHGVGGKKPGTATAGGASAEFHFLHFSFADFTHSILSHGLKQAPYQVRLLAGVGARKHWAAAYINGGDVQPAGCHQHARYDFITVAHQDQAVKLVGNRHGFNGIRNQLPASQGVLHTIVIHGNPVANADYRELNRGTPGSGYTQLGGLGQVP